MIHFEIIGADTISNLMYSKMGRLSGQKSYIWSSKIGKLSTKHTGFRLSSSSFMPIPTILSCL